MKRGFIILTALLFTMTAAMVGCGKAASTPSTPPTTPALTTQEIISSAGQKMDDLTSFHFILDQTGGGTPIAMGIEMNNAVGDIVKPDKLKTTITGTAMGMSLRVDVITLGDKTYMTNPLSGQWELLPNEFKVLSVFDPNSGIAAIMKGVSSPAKVGEEDSGGILCYHLSGTIDSGNLGAITGSSVQGVPVSTDVWIGKDDFLPRQIKLVGKITEGEKDGIVRTLSLSNFDQPVNIEKPV
jgi:hypothetical protein